ncbi:hypothetical protein ACQ4PT_054141 [Festuca glaucescens]
MDPKRRCPVLPDEILARLPAKSVVACHCLSRAWSAALSSDDFIDLYHSLHGGRLKILCLHDEAKSYTDRHGAAPPDGMPLAISAGSFPQGFGYLTVAVMARDVGCEVYVLNGGSTESWRPVCAKPPGWVHPGKISAFAQAGMCVLVSPPEVRKHDLYDGYHRSSEMFIACFSVCEETFAMVPPPPGMDSETLCKQCLTVLAGRLCLFSPGAAPTMGNATTCGYCVSMQPTPDGICITKLMWPRRRQRSTNSWGLGTTVTTVTPASAL